MLKNPLKLSQRLKLKCRTALSGSSLPLKIKSVMRPTRALFAFAFMASLAFTPAPTHAQQALNAIEVLVNDEPISSFDINQRLRLVIALSGGVSSEEEFNQVREQVIQAMIDERLQLQEAAEYELVIPEDNLEDVFSRRAQGVGQTAEQFEQALAQIGTSKKTMVAQMNAEIAWSELVRGRLGQLVNVADEEVESYIERQKKNRGKSEYRVREIVLLNNNTRQSAAVESNAKQLVARIRDGADFQEIAKQLSASPTAAQGGSLGWIPESDLTPTQLEAIKGLGSNSISDPIKTPGGYLIMELVDQRRVLTVDPIDDLVDLRQLWLPTPDAAIPAKRAQFEQYIESIRSTKLDCSALTEHVSASGANERIQLGQFQIRTLTGVARKAIVDLQPGDISVPVDTGDGLRSFIVCEREAAEVQEPNFDEILNQLEQQRLSMMARRYLRDLRRKAIVDYR